MVPRDGQFFHSVCHLLVLGSTTAVVAAFAVSLDEWGLVQLAFALLLFMTNFSIRVHPFWSFLPVCTLGFVRVGPPWGVEFWQPVNRH
jgi:hypothetical protein